ncbi:MAG: hypothetical protein NC293_04495 [Roseburia sp.]|nr:hypothetical protein [Roseburia sp.]
MKQIKNKIYHWNEGSSGPSKYDMIAALVIVLLISCFFCFLKDFKLTVMQSLTFDSCVFNGKVHKFYSIVNAQALSGYYDSVWENSLSAGANYSIINYATLGIICLPLYVIEKIAKITVPFVLYETIVKAVFVVATLYMTKLIGDICSLISMDGTRSKWVRFAFLSSPILWYSCLMISQMDIFSLLFLMLGIRASIKGMKWFELLFYALAVFYKPFALIAIIPILLLKEKRIIYIFRDVLITLAGLLFQNVVYHFDSGYARVQDYMGELYNFSERFFSSGIVTTRNVYTANAGFFVISFVIICVIAYSIRKFDYHLMFALPFAAWCAFVVFVQWHPNWLVFMIPFAVITLGYSYRIKLMCAIECVFTIFFLLVNSLGWLFNYDNDLINGGILPQIFGFHSDGGEFGTIRPILTDKLSAIPVDFYISVLSAAAISMVVTVVMDIYRRRKEISYDINEAKFERGIMWLRSLPMLCFIVYSLVSCI